MSNPGSYFEYLNKIPSSVYMTDWSSEHKPDVVRLFELYSSMFDRLSDVTDDISMLKDLDTQQGRVLDEIGKIVKEPRKGRSDDIYRYFLMVAIQRNISNGSLRKIADITNLIIKSRPGAGFTLTEIFPAVLLDSDHTDEHPKRLLDATWILNPYSQEPATFDINITGIDAELKDYLADVINEIKAAGVNAKIDILT